jgi:hypothetical protein
VSDPVANAWGEFGAADSAYHEALAALKQARAKREQAIRSSR